MEEQISLTPVEQINYCLNDLKWTAQDLFTMSQVIDPNDDKDLIDIIAQIDYTIETIDRIGKEISRCRLKLLTQPAPQSEL